MSAGQWRERVRRARHEAKLWSGAETFHDLGELAARFCEGHLARTPDHAGPRDPETVEIAGPLAHTNRQGFVTTSSQPGRDEPLGEGRAQQRAAVEGWAKPATVEKLRALFAGTRIRMQVATSRPRFRTDYSNAVNVTRVVGPGGAYEHTGFGSVPSRRDFADFGRSDLTDGAAWVTVYDPEWGEHSLLWDRLAEPDWDNSTPPPPTPSPPPRPSAAPTTTGSAGGTGMASIEEVRGMIMRANESANNSLGSLQQAHTDLEQALGMLLQATEGSGQADASEANGLLAQAVAGVQELIGQVSAAISSADTVAARL